MQDGEHEPQSLTSTELQPPTPTSSLQLRLESQAGWLIQLSVRRHDQNGEKKKSYCWKSTKITAMQKMYTLFVGDMSQVSILMWLT